MFWCKLGIHKWSKWINVKGRHITWQRKECVDCGKAEIRIA